MRVWPIQPLPIVAAFGVAMLVLLAATASARVWVVTPDGTGDAPTIQAAIDSSAAGDVVELACGTYTEHDLSLRGGVVIQSASGDPACAVIDAQGLGRCMSATSFDLTTRLQGVTLTGGVSGLPSLGGGINCEDAVLELVDCRINGNQAPGGLFGGSQGGGVRCAGVTFLDAYNCAFEGNYADNGGGIFAGGTSLVRLHDCSFVQNAARGDAGGSGAAICGSGSAKISAEGSSFVRNQHNRAIASKLGDVTADHELSLTDCYLEGNIAAVLSERNVEIGRCRFVGNGGSNVWGSALSVANGGARVYDTDFVENVGSRGGAVYVVRGAAPGHVISFERCLFATNKATDFGGAAYITGQTNTDYDPLVFNQCTFVDNRAPVASGLVCNATTSLEGVIIASGVGGAPVTSTRNVVEVTCTDIWGNQGGDWVGVLAGRLGEDGNIQLDPRFCGPETRDYSLRGDSPCLPANSGGCGLLGARGEGCGVVALVPWTWGRTKAAWRR